ncbi:hypothetical protein Naga_102519g1 [Nannochloropsis gaditana]|uniref:Uncharacterized protein n=1 Tax=Nannochloropsis gaditana TaxID=72520 RepID=W7TIA2_9STRA|nr:hypothetical protein Naga_102519g1 [Nannochloropsis gaditana]
MALYMRRGRPFPRVSFLPDSNFQNFKILNFHLFFENSDVHPTRLPLATTKAIPPLFLFPHRLLPPFLLPCPAAKIHLFHHSPSLLVPFNIFLLLPLDSHLFYLFLPFISSFLLLLLFILSKNPVLPGSRHFFPLPFPYQAR